LTSVIDKNILTSVIYENILTPVIDKNILTSVVYENILTFAISIPQCRKDNHSPPCTFS